MKIRKDQLLVGAIFGVIIVTFALVVFLPQRKELARLQNERDDTAAALERDKQQAVELARLQGDVERMTEQLEYFDQRLPNQQELGQFLRDVSSFAQLSGLEGADFQPREVTEGELFLAMPIEMKFAGDFSELYRFMGHAKRMTRLTHVRDLRVNRKLDPNAKDENCQIDLVMTIYFTRG